MSNPAVLFKALGDETRLRLIHLLLHTEHELCVCEMVDSLLLPQYQISKHLTLLKNAGLLQANRRGTWVYYHLLREEASLLGELIDLLSRHLPSVYVEDAQRLQHRLASREADKCVIGFVAERLL